MTRLKRAIRTAAVLTAIGGVSATWLYVREVAPRESLRRARLDAMRLFAFGRIDVLEGTLVTRGATMTFSRDESGRFRLSAPVAWPADDEAMGALLDRMAAIRADPVLTDAATAEDLARWGLAPPLARLHVRLRDGREHALLVGPVNPLVGKHPITDGAKKRVGLTNDTFFWAFDRPIDDFRSKQLVPFDPSDVGEIRIQPGTDASGLRLRRSAEGGRAEWAVWVAERWVPAAESRAHHLAVALTRRLEASGFLTDAYDPARPEDQRRWGLDDPIASVDLTDLSGAPCRLTFGRAPVTEGGDGPLVVHASKTRTVVEVDAWIEAELAPSPDAFVDRTLSRIQPAEVEAVEMQLGTEPPFRLARRGSRWVLSGREDLAVKSWRVDALLRAMTLLEGDATHLERASPRERAELLLEPPSRRIILLDESGGALADVRFGNRLDEAHLLAQREGDPRVLVVEEKKLVTLPARREDLLER